MTLNKLLVPPWAIVARQAIPPLVGLIVAPAGAANKLKTSRCDGESGSVALGMTARVAPAVTVQLARGASTGGWLLGTRLIHTVLVTAAPPR